VIKYLSFCLLFLLSCTPPHENFNDYSYIKVIEVIDGDTVKLANGKMLRYIGIDTPEIRIKKGSRFIYSPQPFAKEAEELNRDLVENKFVKIEFDIEKTDKYNRLLGYCFINDTFVNAKLIEEGFASIYTKPPNVKYTDFLINLQRKARKNKKGLWGAYEVIDHTQAHLYINQIRSVKGRVLTTYKSKSCIFLNFGQDYKTDFTIVIFNDSFKYFYDAGINPLTFYKGKTVEVRGKIKDYNGPEIIVSSPGEIDIIK
jgi:endonuclease YncB( thermonuclease family)